MTFVIVILASYLCKVQSIRLRLGVDALKDNV